MSARIIFLCATLLLGLPPGLRAVPTLTASLSGRALFDNNVFLQDNAPLAAGQTVAAVPANAEAWVANLAATLRGVWRVSPACTLDASYAPEVFRFSRHQTENHTDHRFALNAAGRAGGNDYDLKTSWLSTDGSHESLIFNRLGGGPPVGTEPVRARRAQDVFKLGGRFTHPFARTFLRATATASEQDFHTRESATYGYANFVDRGEWIAGAEAGWLWRPGIALIAAVRHGRQQQADLLGVSLNYTNRLTRWLVGTEGTVGKTWKFSLLAGPDDRRFDATVRPGFARVQTTTYFEGAATWTPRAADTLSATAKRCLGFSSGGRGVYVDSLYELTWKHLFAPRWALTTGWSHHEGDITPCNPANPRDDIVTALTAGLTFALNAKTKISADIMQDWSRSFVPATSGRVYHRQIFSAGVTRSW